MSEHAHVQYVRSINVVRLQLGSDCELSGCTQMARDPRHSSLSGTPYRCARLSIHIFGSSVDGGVNHVCFFPINLMHFLNCMLCYR